MVSIPTVETLGKTGHFTRHPQRTPKLVQASVRRPGTHTANRKPSCTPGQAAMFDIRTTGFARWINRA